MTTLIQDLRYAVRTYVHNPTLATTAIVVLALGMAATTATYSVVEAIVIRALPFRDADRIVDIKQTTLKFRGTRPGGGTSSMVSLEGVREARASLEEVTAAIGGQPVLTGFGEAERITAFHVDSGFFGFFGAAPILGRAFTADENRQGAPQIAVVNHSFWTSRLAGDPRALGRTLTLDGTSVQIVGVMGSDFQYPAKAVVWRPMGTLVTRTPATANPQGGYWILARLRPGITIAAATAELDQIWQRIAETHPAFKGWVPNLTPLHELRVGTTRRPLLLMLGAAALVLLVACANVANLLLAHAVTRRQEIATRLAIGATRIRLVRQLLTESVLLAAIAGAAGILLAWWAIPMLVSLGSHELPAVGDIGVNSRVLAVALSITLATGTLFGLAPARGSIDKGQGISQRVTRWKSRTGDLFLITQVALTMVLLAGAGLLADTFIRLMNVNMGFASKEVVAAQLTLPARRYASPDSIVTFATRTLERLRAQPQVAAAAVATGMPMASGVIGSVRVDGRPRQEGAPWAVISAVSEDYFRVLQIPLKQGRLLQFEGQADRTSILIDESLARTYFPNEDPLGKRLTFYGTTTSTIVGVVADSRDDLSKEPGPHVYQTLQATPYNFLKVMVRTNGAPQSFAAGLRSTLREIDPELPVEKLATIETMMSDSVARQRFLAVLLVLFGGMTLAIAAAGIYGLVSYTVRRRHREIGIRMALGAQPSQILALISRRGVGLSAVGLVLGIAGAAASMRVLEGVLFHVGARNPLVIAVASVTLGLVAVLATHIPAREAARVNPLLLLRDDG